MKSIYKLFGSWYCVYICDEYIRVGHPWYRLHQYDKIDERLEWFSQTNPKQYISKRRSSGVQNTRNNEDPQNA